MPTIIVVCHTAECGNAEQAITTIQDIVPDSWMCGVCLNTITDVTHD